MAMQHLKPVRSLVRVLLLGMVFAGQAVGLGPALLAQAQEDTKALGTEQHQRLKTAPEGKIKAAHTVLFYNVENLFDTLDTPNQIDEEYLPGSEKLWGTQRYNAKLDSLAHVIAAASGARPDPKGKQRYATASLPLLIGLAEVENAAVCRDLATRLAGEGVYRVEHVESPDVRGIDCALLVRTDAFKTGSVRGIRLEFPESINPPDMESGERYTSRDILYVQGRIKGMKQPLHVFVNHWPSRRGGLEASAPRRAVAARALRSAVDSLRGAEGHPYVLAMGDFNDEPENGSLQDVLGAQIHGYVEPTSLANAMGLLDAEGGGSYNYRGNWNMLDQFVITGVLMPFNGAKYGKAKGWQIGSVSAFREDWMMYFSDRFGATPSRTFGGPNYYAGYSDHLPIVATLYRYKP